MFVISFFSLETAIILWQGLGYLNLCLRQVFVVTKCKVCIMVLCVADFVINSQSRVVIFMVLVYFCVTNTCVEFCFCRISCTFFLTCCHDLV